MINLDRPTDDELVQLYIRHGDTMKVHIGGVGDPFRSTGPMYILRKGRRILKTLKSWPIVDEWQDLLRSLQASLVLS